jgi:hypothetical protein
MNGILPIRQVSSEEKAWGDFFEAILGFIHPPAPLFCAPGNKAHSDSDCGSRAFSLE